MTQPNFILFLTDDQGYGDLSCMGSADVRTPHLDRLAAEGARFTSWYSNSPVCSPSRASLLTGRSPAHAGVRAILVNERGGAEGRGKAMSVPPGAWVRVGLFVVLAAAGASGCKFVGVDTKGEYRESLKPLLAKLPPRERRIIMLRFFANMTQSQIGEEVGISQMHVSRLLTRTLAQLREGLISD